MKKFIYTPLLALLFAGWSAVTAQNRQEEFLGLPGDNLNLFAVLNLFQNSETLEGFERDLNDPNTMINNLDLNRDNLVDYIMVFDYVEGNTHTIVLRAAINRFEHQDIAVFTVQTYGDGTARVQLVGDRALYGHNYIIEPNYAETPNPGYRGNVVIHRPQTTTVVRTTYYEVASWPVIVYISRPTYVVYRSRWHWGYHPVWWAPWRPHYWHFYYGYHYNWHTHYYSNFRPWKHHRSVVYHNYYYNNIRHTSNTVIVNVDKGNYKNTYSRPETRSEGEKLFTHRRSTGSTVSNRESNPNTTQVRRSAGTTTENNMGVARTETGGRASATENMTQRTRRAADETTGSTNRQRTTINNNRQTEREAIQGNPTTRRESTRQPARNENQREVVNTRERRSIATPQDNGLQSNERQVTNTPRRGSDINTTTPVNRSKVTSTPKRDSSPASSRNVQRTVNERTRSTTQSAPASVSRSRENNTPPASVQRSAPANAPRQQAPRASSSDNISRSRNSEAGVQRGNNPGQKSISAPNGNTSSENSRTRRGSDRYE